MTFFTFKLVSLLHYFVTFQLLTCLLCVVLSILFEGLFDPESYMTGDRHRLTIRLYKRLVAVQLYHNNRTNISSNIFINMQSTQLLLVSTLIIAFVLSVSAASTRKWKCDAQSKKEVDETVARIMTYGRVDRVFPIDKNELRSYCKEQSQMISRLEDYKTQCLKGRSKQTVSIIIYSMKNINNLYCKNPSSKRSNDLLNSASCANEATAEYNKCNIDYIDLLLAVENSKDSKQQLSQLCCGYAEVFKCIREKGSLIEMCNDDKIETNINYIRGFFDNAANLICGDFTVDTDKCDKVKMFRKKNKQPSKRPSSYFNPLVNLLSSL